MGEHPGDDELMACADDPQAKGAAHLASCPSCAARVEQARAASRAILRAAPGSRTWCPPREVLVSAFEGLLPAGELVRVDAHVDACPCCRADRRDLEALLEPAPSAAAELGRAVRAHLVLLLDVARRGLELIESSLVPAPAPALVAVRGAAPSATSGGSGLAAFGAGALQLTWVLGSGGADLLARATGAAPRAFRLELGPAVEGGGVWESRTSDAEGVVRIEGLVPGAYQVRAFVPQEASPALVLDLHVRSS